MYLGRFDESLKLWVCDSMLANPHLYSLQPIYVELIFLWLVHRPGCRLAPGALDHLVQGCRNLRSLDLRIPLSISWQLSLDTKVYQIVLQWFHAGPSVAQGPSRNTSILSPRECSSLHDFVHWFRAPTSTSRLHPVILAAEPITSWGPRLFCSQILDTNNNKLKEQDCNDIFMLVIREL